MRPIRVRRHLVHYSKKPIPKGSAVLPSMHGVNNWTPRFEIDPKRLSLAYAYEATPRRLAAPERALQRGVPLHRNEIVADLAIYDVYRDPAGIVSASSDVGEWQHALRDQGWDGYNTTDPYHVDTLQMGEVIASFVPLPVRGHLAPWSPPI